MSDEQTPAKSLWTDWLMWIGCLMLIIPIVGLFVGMMMHGLDLEWGGIFGLWGGAVMFLIGLALCIWRKNAP